MSNGFKGLPGLLREHRATDYSALGKNGATAGASLVGGTTSGPPTAGAFNAGDFVVDQGGKIWVCTAAGTPGTWAAALSYKGAWSNTTPYTAGDLVVSNNQLWVAGTASTGVAPTISSVYAATVLADVPSAYYRVGDTVGAGSALDSSGNGSTGLVRGSVTFGLAGLLTGDGDTACSVNNNNSAIVDPVNYSNPITYSLECWFKTTASGAQQGLMCFEDTSNAQTGGSIDRRVYLDASGHLNAEGMGTTTASYNDGVRHHLVVTLGGGSGKVYVDGAQVLSNPYTPVGYSGFWHFGIIFNGGWFNFTGTLDELAYYNGAVLTAARAAAHYSAGSTANPWVLVAINPMTTAGDMVYGGVSGAPTRLPAGASNTLLAGGTTPAFTGSPTVSGELVASDFKPSGLSGATASSRYVGATVSGAPTSGTFVVGDYVIDQTGKLWICTVAGTPGTWTQGGASSPLTIKGDLYGHSTVDARVPVGADGTFLAADSSQAAGLAYKFPAGMAGLSSFQTQLSADVTLTSTNTYYDGPSLSLTAGTWLVVASAEVENTTQVCTVTAKLWDGTTVLCSGSWASGGATFSGCIPLVAIVSPTSTTTYKISAVSNATNSLLKASAPANAAGNNTTYITAVQLTGAPASGPGALMPAVRCHQSSNLSLSGGVWTAITFDTNIYDQGTSVPQHSTLTNASRLVCQQAGVYSIGGVFQLNSAPANSGARLYLNGTTILSEDFYDGAARLIEINTHYKLNVGDYVELYAFSASANTLITTGDIRPMFWMARVDSGPGAVQSNTKIQLNYVAVADVANAVAVSADTWTNLGPAQSFNVDDPNSVVEIMVRAGAFFRANGNGASASRLVIDNSTNYMLGAQSDDFLYITSAWGSEPFIGTSPVAVAGLTAGAHTVQVQVIHRGFSATLYCRPSSIPSTEFFSVQVLERKQSSSPPSSTPAPAVRCYNSVAQSIANNTGTVLAFDTNRFDQGTSTPQHSTVTNNSRLVCQQSGVYQITGFTSYASNATGPRETDILLNGTTNIGNQIVNASTGGGNCNVIVTTVWNLITGDYVQLNAYQASGGNLSVINAEFMMARLDTGALPSYQAQTKTASYTLTPADASFPVLVDATSGSLTITLPTAVGATQMYQVKKLDSSANTVTVATTASQTIDGAATYVISTQYEAVTLVSNGSQWFIF